MSGGYDHQVLMQRTEKEGWTGPTERQTVRQSDTGAFGGKKRYLSFADVYSNSSLQFDIPSTKHWLAFCFFSSFWLLFDLLKRTSYVSQGPAI